MKNSFNQYGMHTVCRPVNYIHKGIHAQMHVSKHACTHVRTDTLPVCARMKAINSAV